MDFKNWLLLFSIVGIVAYSAYYISNEPNITQRIENAVPSETPQVASEFERPDDWIEYDNEKFNFYHPSVWTPVQSDSSEEFEDEVILNIPESLENSISYSVTPYELLKPEKVIDEEKLIINKREWVKWISEEEGYFSYDIYTKNPIEEQEENSFGVHVTVPERSESLERELLIFVSSIEFNDTSSTPEASLDFTE